jgi:hypothetical protein
MSKLLNYDETVKQINSGKLLVISAPTEMIEKLPKGNYIAGSAYYLITEGKGEEDNDKYYVEELSNDIIKDYKIITYDEGAIKDINKNIPQNGFGYCLIPFACKTHFEFALNAPNYDEFTMKTLYGFISGVRKEDVGIKKAIVKDGSTNTIYEDKAVVLNVELNDNYYSEIDIINPFEADKSVKIEFLENTFEVKDAIINGKKVNLLQYLKEHNIDTRYPIINDAFGAKINISFFKVEEDKVIMGSPVFKGAVYHFAKKTNYIEELAKLKIDEKPTLSCNCFLNYLYMGLENKTLNRSITGPATFGEIAYRLLNQIIVNLHIKKR